MRKIFKFVALPPPLPLYITDSISYIARKNNWRQKCLSVIQMSYLLGSIFILAVKKSWNHLRDCSNYCSNSPCHVNGKSLIIIEIVNYYSIQISSVARSKKFLTPNSTLLNKTCFDKYHIHFRHGILTELNWNWQKNI